MATNYEWIKSMRRIELAWFLNAISAGSIKISGDCEHCKQDSDPPPECVDCVYKWLEEEA